jgi:RNA polymerase sigma-70 factor (ECF subfamily)
MDRAARAQHAEEETAWLHRIGKGEEPAFQALFLRYQQRLIRYLDRLLNGIEQAEEVFQETMIEVWRKARGFKGRSSPATWIYSIARHRAIDRLRRRGEDPADPEDLKRHPDPHPDAAQVVANEHLAERVRETLHRLPTIHREVVELTYYQGCTMEEIAEITGCPVGTVKTRMFHARQRLKAVLAARGITEAEG